MHRYAICSKSKLLHCGYFSLLNCDSPYGVASKNINVKCNRFHGAKMALLLRLYSQWFQPCLFLDFHLEHKESPAYCKSSCRNHYSCVMSSKDNETVGQAQFLSLATSAFDGSKSTEQIRKNKTYNSRRRVSKVCLSLKL